MGSGHKGGGVPPLPHDDEEAQLHTHIGVRLQNDVMTVHKSNVVSAIRVAAGSPNELGTLTPYLPTRVHFLREATNVLVLDCRDVSLLKKVLTSALAHNDADEAVKVYRTIATIRLPRDAGLRSDDPQWGWSLFADSTQFTGVLRTVLNGRCESMLEEALAPENDWPTSQLMLSLRGCLYDGVWTENNSDKQRLLEQDTGTVRDVSLYKPAAMKKTTVVMLDRLCERDDFALFRLRLPDFADRHTGVPEESKHLVNSLPEAMTILGQQSRFLWKIIRAVKWQPIQLVRTLDAAIFNYMHNSNYFAEYKDLAIDLFTYLQGEHPAAMRALASCRERAAMRRTSLPWTHKCEHVELIPILLGAPLRELEHRRRQVPFFAVAVHFEGLMESFEGLMESIVDAHEWPVDSLVAFIEESLERYYPNGIALGFKKLKAGGHALPVWWAHSQDDYQSFLGRLVQRGIDPCASGALSESLPAPSHQAWDCSVLHEALAMAVTLGRSEAVDQLLRVMEAPIPVNVPKFLKDSFEPYVGNRKRKQRAASAGASSPPEEASAAPPPAKEPFLLFVARNSPSFLPALLRHGPSRPSFTKDLVAGVVVDLLMREIALVNQMMTSEAGSQQSAVLLERHETNTKTIQEFLLPPVMVTPADLPAHVPALLKNRIESIVSELYAPPPNPDGVGGRGYEMTKNSFAARSGGVASSD